MCRRLHAAGQLRICLLKVASRGVQPRIHGSHWDSQTRGDLVAGLLFDFEEDEKCAPLDIERLERLLYDRKRLGRLGVRLGAWITTSCRGNRFFVELSPLAGTCAPVRHG